MQRRTFLKLGIAATAAIAATGGLTLYMHQGPWAEGRLQSTGRIIFEALARAILEGTLPDDPAQAARQLGSHLDRVEAAIRQFPPALQSELAQLLAVLDTAAGRRWLFTLHQPWAEATPADVRAALDRLRKSRSLVRQQTYHALRDLTNAAYYSEPGTWVALGYPGPIPI
jgi:hypothetical protein